MAVDGAVQDIEQQQGQGLKVTLLALPKEVRDYTGLTKRGVQAVALQYPEDKTLDKTLAGPSSKLQQSHFESLNECLRQFEKGGKSLQMARLQSFLMAQTE